MINVQELLAFVLRFYHEFLIPAEYSRDMKFLLKLLWHSFFKQVREDTLVQQAREEFERLNTLGLSFPISAVRY